MNSEAKYCVLSFKNFRCTINIIFNRSERNVPHLFLKDNSFFIPLNRGYASMSDILVSHCWMCFAESIPQVKNAVLSKPPASMTFLLATFTPSGEAASKSISPDGNPSASRIKNFLISKTWRRSPWTRRYLLRRATKA